MRLPPDIRALLDELLPSMCAVLGANLIGVYLRGSLATGDFNPITSDLDFLAVTARRVSDHEFAALAALHERLACLPNPYARRIEGSYLDRSAARRFEPGQAHPTIYCDKALRWSEHHSNWTLERLVVREHGFALLGPDPKTLIATVSADELGEAVRQRLDIWAGWIVAPDDPDWLLPRSHSAYMVETMCRALYTLKRGELATKPRAVAWALEVVPAPSRATGAQSQAWRTDDTPDPAIAPEVREFVLWAVARAVVGASLSEQT